MCSGLAAPCKATVMTSAAYRFRLHLSAAALLVLGNFLQLICITSGQADYLSTVCSCCSPHVACCLHDLLHELLSRVPVPISLAFSLASASRKKRSGMSTGVLLIAAPCKASALRSSAASETDCCCISLQQHSVTSFSRAIASQMG